MSSVVVSSKKPFCKVCLDVGKQESEYTNHWTKNDKGKVICPTLLEMMCKYCFKKSHTVSYCPILAKNKKREAFLEKRDSLKNKNKKNINPSKTITNLFQALEEDSDDSDLEEDLEEDVKDVEEEDELDPPCSPVSPPPSFLKPTYASILCKEKKVVNKEALEIVQSNNLHPVLPLKRKLWSDYTSDDDMDGDEYYN
jgi:hypothetical protein